MKASQVFRKLFLGTFLVLLSGTLFAQGIQFGTPNYFRSYDQRGVNVFEPAKADQGVYDGVKIRVGGSFAQQFQMLSHTNTGLDDEGQPIELYPLANGFNTATANLYLAIELADGILLNLENYMSSRHHPEFWVKGGYIQVDKLPMFGSPDWFTDHVRVKIGHYQPNYGDQQFRRTDNGNAMWNPFVGNYIMDAFTTEIGGEVYVWPVKDLMLMGGLTAGFIKGDIQDRGDQGRNPSIYLKAAYDRQVSELVRLRLSASMINNGATPRNTMYGGDRTGSRYYNVLEPPTDYGFTSGRFNPRFNNEINSFMINPFVKIAGLEFFGTYEHATGKANAENERRSVDQISGELIYRFLANEQLYIGGRYNTVTGELFSGSTNSATINRMAIAAGWFPIKNMLLKIEYVDQQYIDFPSNNILNGGKFNGVVLEAVVGF